MKVGTLMPHGYLQSASKAPPIPDTWVQDTTWRDICHNTILCEFYKSNV